MMSEKAPHTGIGIAHILEVDGAVGITEGEVFVLAFEVAPFFGEADDIGGINAFHLRVVDFLEVLAANAVFGALL